MNSEKFLEQLILLKTNLDKKRPGKHIKFLTILPSLYTFLDPLPYPCQSLTFLLTSTKASIKATRAKYIFFLSTTLLKDINEFLEPWEIASTFFLTMERPFVKQDWWNYVGTLCRSLDNRTWICFTMSCKSSRKAAGKNRVLQIQIDEFDQRIGHVRKVKKNYSVQHSLLSMCESPFG